mmetsp:Transcript_35545/g.98374  ORF Transcript_35545/g.98374 Transcript_35545/m.98374 type:complete len:244 (+) Transcript_35545:1829-2560(+)
MFVRDRVKFRRAARSCLPELTELKNDLRAWVSLAGCDTGRHTAFWPLLLQRVPGSDWGRTLALGLPLAAAAPAESWKAQDVLPASTQAPSAGAPGRSCSEAKAGARAAPPGSESIAHSASGPSRGASSAPASSSRSPGGSGAREGLSRLKHFLGTNIRSTSSAMSRSMGLLQSVGKFTTGGNASIGLGGAPAKMPKHWSVSSGVWSTSRREQLQSCRMSLARTSDSFPASLLPPPQSRRREHA